MAIWQIAMIIIASLIQTYSLPSTVTGSNIKIPLHQDIIQLPTSSITPNTLQFNFLKQAFTCLPKCIIYINSFDHQSATVQTFGVSIQTQEISSTYIKIFYEYYGNLRINTNVAIVYWDTNFQFKLKRFQFCANGHQSNSQIVTSVSLDQTSSISCLLSRFYLSVPQQSIFYFNMICQKSITNPLAFRLTIESSNRIALSNFPYCGWLVTFKQHIKYNVTLPILSSNNWLQTHTVSQATLLNQGLLIIGVSKFSFKPGTAYFGFKFQQSNVLGKQIEYQSVEFSCILILPNVKKPKVQLVSINYFLEDRFIQICYYSKQFLNVDSKENFTFSIQGEHLNFVNFDLNASDLIVKYQYQVDFDSFNTTIKFNWKDLDDAKWSSENAILISLPKRKQVQQASIQQAPKNVQIINQKIEEQIEQQIIIPPVETIEPLQPIYPNQPMHPSEPEPQKIPQIQDTREQSLNQNKQQQKNINQIEEPSQNKQQDKPIQQQVENSQIQQPPEQQQFLEQKQLNTVTKLSLLLQLFYFIFFLLSIKLSKFVAFQFISFLQFSFYVLLPISNNSLIKPILQFQYASGINIKYDHGEQIQLGQNYKAFGFSSLFVSNCNIMLMLIVIPLIVYLIAYALSKTKCIYQQQLQNIVNNKYQSFIEWTFILILFNMYNVVISLVISIQTYKFNRVIQLITGFMYLVLPVCFNLILDFKNKLPNKKDGFTSKDSKVSFVKVIEFIFFIIDTYFVPLVLSVEKLFNYSFSIVLVFLVIKLIHSIRCIPYNFRRTNLRKIISQSFSLLLVASLTLIQYLLFDKSQDECLSANCELIPYIVSSILFGHLISYVVVFYIGELKQSTHQQQIEQEVQPLNKNNIKQDFKKSRDLFSQNNTKINRIQNFNYIFQRSAQKFSIKNDLHTLGSNTEDQINQHDVV